MAVPTVGAKCATRRRERTRRDDARFSHLSGPRIAAHARHRCLPLLIPGCLTFVFVLQRRARSRLSLDPFATLCARFPEMSSSRSSFQNTSSGNRPSSSASSVPSLAAVADPPLRYVDGAAMDYFVIEMVNTLRTSAAVATARAKKVEQEMIEAGLMPASAPTPPPLRKSQLRDSTSSNISRNSAAKDGKDEDEDELRIRLEAIGMHVGANIAERFVRPPSYYRLFSLIHRF